MIRNYEEEYPLTIRKIPAGDLECYEREIRLALQRKEAEKWARFERRVNIFMAGMTIFMFVRVIGRLLRLF